MNITDNKKQLGLIARMALNGQLLEALDSLNALSRNIALWQINSDVEKLQDNYTAFLRYMANGAGDAGRSDICDTITAEALALAMRLSRELTMESGSDIYYSTARTVFSANGGSLKSLVNEYQSELRRLDDDFESLTDSQRTVRAEQLLREIFNRIWVTHPLSTEDFSAIDELMSPSMPHHVRASVISSVGLGHVCYYDTKRLAWLLSRYVEYAESDPDLGLRALVEALGSMVRYRRRPISHAVKTVLAAARDLTTWEKDFTSVAIELMRAVGTENLSEKMKEGILGQINKIDSELGDKLKKGEIDLEAISSEYNPEWAEKIEQSKLGQNLRELAEIQAEGGDVFMMSFSQMKRFPFFHELPNWFLPFYEGHSSIVSADTADGLISSLLAKMPVLCDSDKYSLIFSITNIPSAQREQLASALRMQAAQMAESLTETAKASGDSIRRNIVNKYIQNLYRFLNLFRDKNGFYNCFAQEHQRPDLLQVKALSGNPANEDMYETIAEFYFKNHHWQEAAAAFSVIDKNAMPDARRTQEMAYAYERSGMLGDALQRYEEAEMLDGGSEWTIRRLANLLRHMGEFKRSSGYYKRLSADNPDDAGLALACAETLLDANLTVDAEQAFHKVVYLMPESFGALRGLAWTLFLNGKFDRAAEVYEKIIAVDPTKDDYERAAFIKWAKGDLKGAVELMGKYISGDVSVITELDQDINSYHSELKRVGVDLSLQNIIIETLRFLHIN